jgi:predicted RNase H-like nuclease
MMTEYLRRELALDDAIDAAVLAFAARRILQCGTAGSLPRQAPTDSLGLPMAILLPPG